MNAGQIRHAMPTGQLLRRAAEALGGVLFAGWLALVVRELVHNQFEFPPATAMYQGIALAVVFAGYALFGRHTLVGSTLVFVGIATFFVVGLITLGVAPGLPTLWFALPGALALLAWYYQRQEVIQDQR